MRDIHISIVSHGQFELVKDLLNDLMLLPCVNRIQVTLSLNIPEKYNISNFELSYPINIVMNYSPKGFAENQNNAFYSPPSKMERKYYVVINPDVRVYEDILTPIVNNLNNNPHIGVMAPAVLSGCGDIQDNARKVPTPLSIFQKLAGKKVIGLSLAHKQFYHPDWVAGMFMCFPVDVFMSVNGFDEKYFLYYEDVDICCRIRLNGYSVVMNPNISIVHAGQRASHRDVRYFRWHLISMLRFFSSDVFRKVILLDKTDI